MRQTEVVYCTCGTELVEGALFCHKCGKAQRELLAEPPATSIVEPLPPVPAAAILPVDFHNPIAVRTAITAASLATILAFIPFVNLLFLVWCVGAGFLAVVIYRRRTGQRLSVSSGARMGWITAVILLIILTLLLTVAMVMLTTAGHEFRDQISKQLGAQNADMNKLLDNPLSLIPSVLLLFVLLSAACVAGGALGAKMVGKDQIDSPR